MATTSTSDVQYISKILYKDGIAQSQIVRDKPLLSATPQKTNFATARGMEIPVIASPGQGVSATVATAAANASASKGVTFTVTQKTIYKNIDIAGIVLRNAQKGNDDTYFLQQFKLEMDNAMEAMGVELARQEYGSSTGVRAQASNVAGGVITLANPQDAVYFEYGMVIVASQTAGGTLRSGSGVVSAVDTSAGTVTYTGTITSVGTTDYFYEQGNAQNGGTALLMSGLADWVPATVTATPFFGVDRTIFPSRLAGVRYDGTNDNTETVLIKAAAKAMAEVGPGFKKGDVYMNPVNFAAFQTAKEGGRWITEPSSYNIGIDKFQIGAFKLVPDALCPVGVAYMINDGAFIRASCGDAPFWQDQDGSDLWLDRTTDTIKGQLVHDGNFAAVHPQRIMRIALPAV